MHVRGTAVRPAVSDRGRALPAGWQRPVWGCARAGGAGINEDDVVVVVTKPAGRQRQGFPFPVHEAAGNVAFVQMKDARVYGYVRSWKLVSCLDLAARSFLIGFEYTIANN